MRSPARAEHLRAAGCRLLEGGLEDERVLAALVDGQDVVYHVAGVVAAQRAEEFWLANRDGAARLARASRAAAVGRFLLVSSLAATGPSRPGQAVDEASGPGPLTAYGRSKLAGEEAVRETGVPLTVVRPPAVYGPRDRGFLTLFRMAARGVVPLPGDGRQPLTLVHARDLARALVAAAASPRTLGSTYHAGNDTPLTQRELAEAVGRTVGRRVRCLPLPPALVRPLLGLSGTVSRALGRAPLLDADKSNELLAPGWACLSDALRQDAGWRPEITLEAGLAETAGSYRALGWL